MHYTQRLLAAPGYGSFWRRSLDELKRLSIIAAKFEAIKTPTRPYQLVEFSNAESLGACKTMSDADMGGFSQANFDFTPGGSIPSTAVVSTRAQIPPPHARFHGSISTALPDNRPEIQRTGYAGFRTIDRPPTLFGRSFWDVDPYAYLALRVKSDGRKYFVNLQTESIVPTDLHQHRLYIKKPGEWETVLIRFGDFVRTNHGMPVEPQMEMLRQKVRTVGFSLTDRIEGPFELCINRIWATNGLSNEEKTEGGWLDEQETAAGILAGDGQRLKGRNGELGKQEGTEKILM